MYIITCCPQVRCRDAHIDSWNEICLGRPLLDQATVPGGSVPSCLQQKTSHIAIITIAANPKVLKAVRSALVSLQRF